MKDLVMFDSRRKKEDSQERRRASSIEEHQQKLKTSMDIVSHFRLRLFHEKEPKMFYKFLGLASSNCFKQIAHKYFIFSNKIASTTFQKQMRYGFLYIWF